MKRISASLVHTINEALDEFTDSSVKENILDSLAVYHAERFRVEEREHQVTAKDLRALFGSTLSGYIDWMKAEVKASRIALSTAGTIEDSPSVQEVLDTMWGNDYGAFLDVAFYKGAMFQTTKPSPDQSCLGSVHRRVYALPCTQVSAHTV